MNDPTATRWLEAMPLDSLIDATRNPKGHAEKIIEQSIGRFGMVEMIVLDERTGRIISGHGRRNELKRLRDAGAEPPEGVEIGDDGEWKPFVVRGWRSRSDEDAEAAGIALNRAGELGGWLDRELADVLGDLREIPGGLDGLGYTDDMLDELMRTSGKLGDDATDFLGGLVDPSARGNPLDRSPNATGADSVNFQLPMTKADRDEALLRLRTIQRSLGDEKLPLAGVLLAVLRSWNEPEANVR